MIEDTLCPWGCGLKCLPKPVQTKNMKAIKYECTCGAWTFIARPYKDLEFWDTII